MSTLSIPISYENIVKSKLPSSYPKFLLDNIALMSINKNKSALVGSYSFAYPQFPSDVDVREVVDEGYTYEGVVDFFIRAIRKKVIEIQAKQYHWVLEVKIGYDPDSGEPLRWSYDDILRGYITDQDYMSYARDVSMKKTMIGIRDAVMQKSVINMEVVGVSNNKLTDMSTFFALVYRDKNGDLHSVNLPDGSVTDFSSFYVRELKESIASLEASGNYAKIMKRYFSLGRFINDQELIESITPFVNSIYAIAGQKKGEISLMIKFWHHIFDLYDKGENPDIPMDIINNQLMNIKISLSNVVEIPPEYLEDINEKIDAITGDNTDGSEIVSYLEDIEKFLSEYVNENAKKYLENEQLLPVPTKYLP